MITIYLLKAKRKIEKSLYTYVIKKKYNLKKHIEISGKVTLDNPNIFFGENVSLYDGVQIWGTGKVELGDNVAIGKDTIIFSNHSITIGDNTLIAAQCYIIDSDHGILKNQLIRTQKLVDSKVYIGCDVWIGAGSKILKGSHISDGSIIGAASLTNKLTEPYSINVGIPSKKIGERN